MQGRLPGIRFNVWEGFLRLGLGKVKVSARVSVRVRVRVRTTFERRSGNRTRVRVRDRTSIRFRLGGGVVGSVHVATTGSAHGTLLELQLLILPQHHGLESLGLGLGLGL